MKSIAPVLGIALLATPVFAQKVTVDYDRDYDRAQVSTYAWATPEQVEQNPLMHQRIVNAINYWLTMEGEHTEVKPEANPDVYLTYHSDSKDEVVLSTSSFGYGYGGGWGYRGMGAGMGGMGSSTTTAHTYTKGTLIIDIWDAKSKNLVFRGTITDTVSPKPDKMEKKINKGVEKLIKAFDKQIKKDEKKAKKEAEKAAKEAEKQ